MTNKISRIAGIGILSVASLLSGCMSNDAVKLSLLDIEYQRRASVGTPKEEISDVSGNVYAPMDTYQQNRFELTQGSTNNLVNKLRKGYANRNETSNQN